MAEHRFAIDVRAFAEKTKGRFHVFVGKLVLDIGTSLVERSPVGNPDLWASPAPKGYVGGRFRANWQYSTVGAGVPSLPIDAIDASGAETIARIAEGIGLEPAGQVHVLVNNLPYAQALEEGWSSQAPGGMVGLTVIEFEQFIRDAQQESES